MKLLNNQGSPSFAPGFDKDASVWCKNCGQGDSIIEVWKAHIEEHRPVMGIDIGNIDSYPMDTIIHSDEYVYQCTNCGHEEQDLEAIVTDNIFEANEAYKIYNQNRTFPLRPPISLVEEEEDQGEEDSE